MRYASCWGYVELSCWTQRLGWPTNTKNENLQANLLYLGWKHLLNQLEELLVNSISRALYLYRNITPTFVIQDSLVRKETKKKKRKIQRRNKSHLFQIHRDHLSVQRRKFEPLGVSCVMQRAIKREGKGKKNRSFRWKMIQTRDQVAWISEVFVFKRP